MGESAEPGRLSVAEHLWRAQVGWLGGLIMWIAAAAILAPLTLGGFEVTARGEQVGLVSGLDPRDQVSDAVIDGHRRVAEREIASLGAGYAG